VIVKKTQFFVNKAAKSTTKNQVILINQINHKAP